MTLERFLAILDAYGGDPHRWPQAERQAAKMLCEGSQAAQEARARAQALDSLLQTAPDAPASRALQNRILERLADAAPRTGWGARLRALAQAIWPGAAWRPAAALAASAVIGLAAGVYGSQSFALGGDELAVSFLDVDEPVDL